MFILIEFDTNRELFIFTVLNNFHEMAQCIWKKGSSTDKGHSPIVAALTATGILKTMAARCEHERLKDKIKTAAG